MRKIHWFFLLIIFIVIILGFIFLFSRKKTFSYFDGVVSIDKSDTKYVAVGYNNDNDLHYNKAKLTMYDTDKNKLFEKLYNIGIKSAFNDVIFDDGDVVAVGNYVKKKELKKNYATGVIVKYDSKGNIIFDKSYHKYSFTTFNSIYNFNDYYYVVGQSFSSNEGGAILLKIDKEGNIIWEKYSDKGKNSVYQDLIIVDNSIYVVGGYDYKGIIDKYDLDGNYLTGSIYDNIDKEGFTDIASNQLSIYVVGASFSDDNSSDALIVKYNMDCEFEKETLYHNDGLTKYHKLIIDDDSLITIGSITIKNKNKKDEVIHNGVIGKYNLALEEISVSVNEDERDDYFKDIFLENDNYIVVGYSAYEDGNYYSKFIRFSDALKVLSVDSY